MSDRRQDDLPFYKVDRTFVRIMNAVIDQGLLAEIRPVGLAILLVIKRHVPYEGISSWPSHSLIAKKCGVTRQTVANNLDNLIELGLLSATKFGRGWKYTITEKFYAISQDPEQRPDGWVEFDYGPLNIKKKEKAIKHFERTGEIQPGSGIRFAGCDFKIEVNNFYEGSKQIRQEMNVTINQEDFDQLPSWLQQKMKSIKANAEKELQELGTKGTTKAELEKLIDKKTER